MSLLYGNFSGSGQDPKVKDRILLFLESCADPFFYHPSMQCQEAGTSIYPQIHETGNGVGASQVAYVHPS